MEEPPNAVVTHRGGIHGDPVTAQRHGTRHTSKPVGRRKNIHPEGEGEGEQSGQLACD